MRRPCNSFDSSDVVAEAVQWRLGQLVPDAKFVIVSARGELPVFGVPAESTDFLFVAGKAPEILVRRANITVVYEPVA